MAQKIDIRPEKDYLYVKVSGAYDHANATAFVRRALEESARQRLPRIFADIRDLVTPASVLNRLELARLFAADRSNPIKLAVLCNRNHVGSDGFFEAAADNRGVLVKVTDNQDEALEWLSPKDSNKQSA